MREAWLAKRMTGRTDLFGRIGAFLSDHRLDCDPATYAFVHAVLTEPDGALARAVAELVDDGVRLSAADVARFGGRAAAGEGASPPPDRAKAETAIDRSAADLVSATQVQVDGFAEMMRSMQVETRGFGHDLATTAKAITEQNPRAIGEVSRLAAAMVARVRASELRLAQATEESEALRSKLADAHDAARRDPLTNLPNRLAFAEAYAQPRPADRPHCLALCDVDRFKRINDRHGHGVGDRVLRAIGQALTEACEGQIVARHGGEEFAILLADKTLEEAGQCLDKARERVAAKRFRDRDTDTALGIITFSAGVTALRTDETAEQATERADQLLYAAKAQGRDRICIG